MRCPSCQASDCKVVDSRPLDDNKCIRRRRECPECHYRFTTYEIIDTRNPIVIKKNGSREIFDKNKLLVGIIKACEKRPVDAKAIADDIEAAIQSSMMMEVTSAKIGDMVMEKLRQKDAVAYVRFASVHREFKDIETFAREISVLQESKS